MTPQDVINEVRYLLQDTRPPHRYVTSSLLGFVNQTLQRVAMIRPDLFAHIGDITVTADTAVQKLPSDAMRLIEIFQVKDGNTVVEASRQTLDQAYPGWMSAASSVPVNWMRHPRNPTSFFLYPRPAAGTVLVGEYSKQPNTYQPNDTITELSDTYFPTLVDGVMFLASSMDDEHVNSGRAKVFFDSFAQGLGANVQSRVVTDLEDAGMDPQRVIASKTWTRKVTI